jgi:hypothetical protein
VLLSAKIEQSLWNNCIPNWKVGNELGVERSPDINGRIGIAIYWPVLRNFFLRQEIRLFMTRSIEIQPHPLLDISLSAGTVFGGKKPLYFGHVICVTTYVMLGGLHVF